MKILQQLLHFLQGTYASFGTSANLLREIVVSVLTAVAVALLVQWLTPAPPSPVGDWQMTLQAALAAQRDADSSKALLREWKLQGRIDSLKFLLLKRDEKDSMRANAGLSTLDAMRRLNSAVGQARHSK